MGDLNEAKRDDLATLLKNALEHFKRAEFEKCLQLAEQLRKVISHNFFWTTLLFSVNNLPLLFLIDNRIPKN